MQFIFISVKGHTTSIDTSFRTDVSFLNNTLQLWNYNVVKHTYGQAELTFLFSLQLLCVPEYTVLKKIPNRYILSTWQ